MIIPGINKLKNTKSKGKEKRKNILNVLENLKSVFHGGYLNYENKPSESELKSEEITAERTKLRRLISTEQLNEHQILQI